MFKSLGIYGTTKTRIGDIIARAKIEDDDSNAPPWENSDGHGEVTGWTTRGKAPGELVLNSDRHSKRFYDFQGACRIARRDGWGSLYPYELTTRQLDSGLWEASAKAFRLEPLVATSEDINKAISAVYDMRKAQLGTSRAYAANAARADFEFLRGWCNDEWRYVGVCVQLFREDEEGEETELTGEYEHALWGVESNSDDYLLETANELLAQALDAVGESVA